MSESVHTSVFLSQPWWPMLAPLLSLLINGLWLGRKNRVAAGWFSTALMAFSLVWTVGLLRAYTAGAHEEHGALPALVAWSFRWAQLTPDLSISIGVYLDAISVMMLLVVAVIGFLVNVYSIGYMREDKASGRFFALLAFFIFSMMGLVVSVNLLQTFIFWELVGVSSYQLIAFWYTKPSAVAAGQKAFIVTRFADSFFMLGIILVAWSVHALDFTTLNGPSAAATLNHPVVIGPWSFNGLALGTLLIFAGGWGKSAMFPLHIWLPDAMEGPTPVSSIIHSATMVVAGVYLTARMFPLFAAATYTLPVIAAVGAVTALFAALVACTQKDIKRILAFSTLSQIGYMMLALGVTRTAEGSVEALGFSASMFHIFTHAFFKCLLFLGAGVVIHAVHTNDLDGMGGLRSHLPVCYVTVLIATLAIAGVYPLSGFFSKDEILLACLSGGHRLLFGMALATGGLTAFYMFRFFYLIFHGEPRGRYHHIHEDPIMVAPMVALAIPSIGAGWLLKDLFLGQVVPPAGALAHHEAHVAWLPWVAGSLALLGWALAWRAYGRSAADAAGSLRIEGKAAWYRFLYAKGYLDEVWLFFARRIVFNLVARPLKWIDRRVVDGSMDATGASLQWGGILFRFLQNGQLAFYISVYLLGVLAIWHLSGGHGS